MIGKFRQWFSRYIANSPAPSQSNARRCERCEGRQVFHITTITPSGELTELHLCDSCARPVLTQPHPPAAAPLDLSEEVQCEIERIVISEAHAEQVIFFREIAGDRRLPLICGIFEATAADRLFKRVSTPRPLTHDAWQSTIGALGAKVQSAYINDRQENTFFAELRLNLNGSTIRVDVRPSDAIIVAAKAGAPILIASRLLADANESFPKST